MVPSLPLESVVVLRSPVVAALVPSEVSVAALLADVDAVVVGSTPVLAVVLVLAVVVAGTSAVLAVDGASAVLASPPPGQPAIVSNKPIQPRPPKPIHCIV